MAEIFGPGSSLTAISNWLEQALDAARRRTRLTDERRPTWTCSSTRASSTSPATASRCSPGGVADTVDEAVAAGRGGRLPGRRQGPGAGRRARQGGRHQARQRRRRGAHARREHPRHGHQGPRRQAGLGRARLRHRRGVLRQLHARPGGQAAPADAVGRGRRRDRGRSPTTNPDAIVKLHIDPVDGLSPRRPPGRPRSTPSSTRAGASTASADILVKLYRCFTEGDCDLAEINPLILKPDRRGPRPRRQGQPRRQRRVPPPRVGGVRGHRGARRARAAGQGEGPAVHRPRRHRSASSPTAPGWR